MEKAENADILLGWSGETIMTMSIFQPYAMTKLRAAVAGKQRFVHYTSAETASLILQSRTVLLRQAPVMNDFREIEFGTSCIERSWRKHQAAFDDAFRGIDEQFGAKLWQWLTSWKDLVRWQTFVTCVSEHDEAEDVFGRLSMWRAYGGVNGVALVFHGVPFFTASDALGAYSSPVAYHTPETFDEEFEALITRVKENEAYLKAKPAGWVFGQMCHTLHYAMLCTKHFGFWEEREWRVVQSPAFNKPTTLQKSVKVIGGVPQAVLSLELKDDPTGGLVGIEIPSLFDRIIIGPTQQPLVIADALATLLAAAGVVDATKKVAVSDIPLRR